MLPLIYIILTLVCGFALFSVIKRIRLKQAGVATKSSSLPIHYAYCFFIWSFVVFVAVIIAGSEEKFFQMLLLASSPILFAATYFLYKTGFRAKKHFEKVLTAMFLVVTCSCILITVGIAASIIFEATKFFKLVSFTDFLFGVQWNPQLSTGRNESYSDVFGVLPVLIGTITVTVIAVFIAVPLGILSASYLSFYAKKSSRDFLKPAIEVLAGIPTVVYGYFAVTAVAPFLKGFMAFIGVSMSAESAIVAGIVMGVMIIPFVTSLSDDALNSVPSYLKDGALAMGSTKSEMIRKVAIPAAMPGIIGAIILAVSRAMGETMIVVMAAGLVAKMSANPLEPTTTITVQIVSLLTGDQEFDNPKTLAAFALALVLFVLTLFLNITAIWFGKGSRK